MSQCKKWDWIRIKISLSCFTTFYATKELTWSYLLCSVSCLCAMRSILFCLEVTVTEPPPLLTALGLPILVVAAPATAKILKIV